MMPTNPHLIPRRAKEIGAASRISDLEKRLRSQESKQGYFGVGASVTGGWIGTSDTDPAIYFQGPSFSGGAGFFMTNGTGTVVLSITPAGGMVLATSGGAQILSLTPAGGLMFANGPAAYNGVSWDNNCSIRASGTSSPYMFIHATGASSNYAEIELKGNNDGGFPSQVIATCNTHSVVVVDGTGGSEFSSVLIDKGLGVWGTAPGGSQPVKPATPTLSDVVNLLTTYGFWA